jgi:MFS family permease
MTQNPLIKYPEFRKLFISRVISAIGDKFFSLSLVWWVISNNNPGYSLSMVMAAMFLPSVIFSPLMGALSDRHNKKTLMITADIIRATLLFVLFTLIYKNLLNFSILILIVFLIYSFAPLFETSTASSLKILTSDKDLPQATAVDSSSIGISNVVGAALGSVFIAVLGFKGCVLLNAITYFLSFVFVYQIRKNLLIREESKPGYFNDLKNGFFYIKNEKKFILKLLIFFGILNFFVSPILMLIPVIVKFILEKEVKWLAIIETFFASGTLIASYLLSFKKDVAKNIEYLMISVLVFAISFFATAFIKMPYLTAFLIFICGFSISAGNVLILSYFQKEIDDEYKGRFFSLINTIVYSIMPLSFIINGFLIEKIDLKNTIFLNSLFAFMLGIYGLTNFSEKVKK